MLDDELAVDEEFLCLIALYIADVLYGCCRAFWVEHDVETVLVATCIEGDGVVLQQQVGVCTRLVIHKGSTDTTGAIR